MMPSASSASIFVMPAIAGGTSSCTLGMTNVSIVSVAAEPARTAASTAATSPFTSTMYLPEQIVRASTSSTAAAFSIVSVTRKPAAMLPSSMRPSETFTAICLSRPW